MVSEKKIFEFFSHSKSMETIDPRDVAKFDPRGMAAGIFLPFQNRDPGPMILGKIIRISVKLGKWIQNRTGDIMHIWC